MNRRHFGDAEAAMYALYVSSISMSLVAGEAVLRESDSPPLQLYRCRWRTSRRRRRRRKREKEENGWYQLTRHERMNVGHWASTNSSFACLPPYKRSHMLRNSRGFTLCLLTRFSYPLKILLSRRFGSSLTFTYISVIRITDQCKKNEEIVSYLYIIDEKIMDRR